MHPLSRAPEPTSLRERIRVPALTPVMFFNVHHPQNKWKESFHTPAPCSQVFTVPPRSSETWIAASPRKCGSWAWAAASWVTALGCYIRRWHSFSSMSVSEKKNQNTNLRKVWDLYVTLENKGKNNSESKISCGVQVVEGTCCHGSISERTRPIPVLRLALVCSALLAEVIAQVLGETSPPIPLKVNLHRQSSTWTVAILLLLQS